MEEEKSLKLNTLPRRIKGRHTDTFRPLKFDSNYFRVSTRLDIKEIYIFKVVYKPSIPFDDSKKRMMLLESARSEIKEFISIYNLIFRWSHIQWK